MKSFAKLFILAVVALSAASAFADAELSSNTATNDPGRIRFDVRCDFGSVGCDAHARIFKTWQDDNATSIQPEWGGNLLSISCRGQLIYANDAALYKVQDHDDFHWEIRGVNTFPLIALGDRPFDGNPSPKDVDARLDFGHGHESPGKCTIDRVFY